MTWPSSFLTTSGLPSGPRFPAVDQSQDILVGVPPRAKVGMWQVWHATFAVWSFSLALALCGVWPWQAWQVPGLLVSALPRRCAGALSCAVGAYRLPGTWCESVLWQVAQVKLFPSASMWTSSAFSGTSSEPSRSPCLTPSPPPPLKWHVPHVMRLVLPTCWATVLRSLPLMMLPEPGGSSMSLAKTLPARPACFLYFPVVSWHTRQSTFCSDVKSKPSSFSPYPTWQVAQPPRFDEAEVQKLLTTCLLPRTCPVVGFTYSHFQCCVLCISFAAAVWQVRQARVTSGPDAKFSCSAANLLWSGPALAFAGLSAAAPMTGANSATASAKAATSRVLVVVVMCILSSPRSS